MFRSGARALKGVLGRERFMAVVLTAEQEFTMSSLRLGRVVALGACVAALCATSAHATWSIIIIDTRTREIAIGSATCLTGFDLRANTPVLITGVGAATAQSFVDSTGRNRVFIRDRLLEGVDPTQILTGLSTFDPGHQTRQYGIADTLGRAATFSGTGAGQWAGGRTGQVGDLVYAVQGNVITGQPVVDMAIAAIEATPGDLAAKMMAAMEAARLMGGDGRCSCLTGPPPSCGSPPPMFTKSAHIAYMMIARAGDASGCNGLYRTASGPFGIAASDLTGDGLPELIVANAGNASISILTNTTPLHSPFAVFTTTPLQIPMPAVVRALRYEDLDGDLIPDIASVSPTGRVYTLKGRGGTTFDPPVTYTVGNDSQDLIIADLDGLHGPDIATANISSGGISVLRSDGAGGYLPAVTYQAGGNLQMVEVVDVNGDGHLDLVYPGRTINLVATLINDGAGAFSMGPFLPVGSQPVWITTGDFDGNMHTDMAVATRGTNAVSILSNQGGGTFVSSSVPTPGPPILIEWEDVDGDQINDLVVFMTGTTDLAVLKGDGVGGFTLLHTAQTQAAPSRFIVRDLNDDGITDIAASGVFRDAVTVIQGLGDGGGGRFNSGVGCGTGDHYMNFNVAFAQFLDPDPVFTLRDMYDQWRMELEGRPDAVQSPAVGPDLVRGSSHVRYPLVVHLHDWRGEAVTMPVDFSFAHAAGSAGLATLDEVEPVGGGEYILWMRAGDGTGHDRLLITIDDGVRPVTLMPETAVEQLCAADCTLDRVLDIFDFLCFGGEYAALDPYACNCDTSTGPKLCDIFDYLCFLNLFAQGCP